MQRPEIEEVFTPRASIINNDMYVKRPELEEDLLDSIKGSMHTMLFGESGNGKSWLYKHVLGNEKINFVIANCGNASRLGSLTAEIHKACLPSNYLSKTSVEDTKSAGVKVFAEAKLTSKNKYDLAKDEPLLEAFKYLASSNRKNVVVIENLEAIAGNQGLMDELSNMILLLDDDRYAECKVKLLIVGTPNGVLEFFGKSKNLPSVTNRINEINKVAGLTDGQVEELVGQGFNKLKIQIKADELVFLNKFVMHMTLGIAQRVQELCSCIATQVKKDGWLYSRSVLLKAADKWLNKGLRSSYVVIESHLNSIETTVGRRNQVIFAIGQMNRSPFSSAEVENFIRSEFPSKIPETNMGIGTILGELCLSTNPLIKKNNKSANYTILDPVHVMAIRLVLKKDATTEKVVKRIFKTN
jgi:hypothetical protein